MAKLRFVSDKKADQQLKIATVSKHIKWKRYLYISILLNIILTSLLIIAKYKV